MKRSYQTVLILLFVTKATYAQNTAAPTPPPSGPAETPSHTQAQSQSEAAGGTAPQPASALGSGTAQPSSTNLAPGVAAGPPVASPAAPSVPPNGPGGDEKPFSASPLKIENSTGMIKLGVLMQPQFESVGSQTLNHMSNNLFVRRARILLGGTLFSVVDFFLETDYPDLFKATPTGTTSGSKSTPGMNLQDVQIAVKLVGDQLKVDAGYMLPPLAHNALQSAASLYGWDYFANSFRHSNVFDSSANPIGRDVGVQVRGLLFDKGVVEYRLGMFQGKRGAANDTSRQVASQNFFRVAGRIQLNLLDPEPGFFYSGTYFGKKRILSLGASYDFQEAYRHWSLDGFLDLPVGPGVLTGQVDAGYWDGKDWVAMPAQTALMAEAGYFINAIRLSPIGRVERRWVDHATTSVPEETRWSAGLAFWPFGHGFNVKAFYSRIVADNPDNATHLHGFNQVNVQAQVFVY